MMLVFTGLYIGILHILSAPDHLASLIPIGLANRSKVWRIGINWGLGHLLGICLLGLVIYFLKLAIPVDKISEYSNKCIGVLLITLGIWIIYQAYRKGIQINRGFKNASQVSFGMGIIQGLAGFSHIYSLLPAFALTHLDFFYYFFGFATGNILSIALITYLLQHIPARFFENNKPYRLICYASGSIAVMIGIYILFFPGFCSLHL